MGIKDIIAIVLVVVVCFATIMYFFTTKRKKTKRIRSLLESYPDFVLVLLDEEKLPSATAMSKEQANKILSFSDCDWEEWKSLSVRCQNLANKYPKTLYDFINEHFPKHKERTSYKKNMARFTPVPKIEFAVASLLLDELRKIDSDSESVWHQRDDQRQLADKIRQKFPEGYKTFFSIQKSSNPQYSEIVYAKRQIAELQKLYEESKGYEGWEKKQEDFCITFWNILDDVRPQDGRYPYWVSFNKPSFKGSLSESKFKVWQGFCNSFSSFLLDKQTDDFKTNYDRITSFKNRNRFFINQVYDNIFEIIEKIDSKLEGDLFVIFIDECKRKWRRISYDYHYKYIRELIDDSDIFRFNFSELPSVTDNGNIGGVFVLDFITSNEELISNCKFIIEHFNKSVPLIGYYSMIKEYDEEELLSLAKGNERFLDSEENDIEFIKKCLLQVRKHSYFSYLAIPNTWIGEAAHAEATKSKWLDNPAQYDFKTTDKEGCISGKYSIDGGKNYKVISVAGDIFDVDDIAQFTYRLLKGMNVLSQFKENGHKAIEYMNTVGFLAHR